MNELIHILTLQNATFNGWAWVIGAVILLITIGMQWDEGEHKFIPVAIALLWPFFLVVSLIMGIIYTPIWIGRKIKDMGL